MRRLSLFVFGCPDIPHGVLGLCVILEIFWSHIWVIKLFFWWQNVSVEVVIWLRFYRIENYTRPHYSSYIIVDSSDVFGVRSHMIFNWKVEIR